MKKLFLGLILLFICAFAFTMNKTFQSIDDLAYVIALGIDVGNTEKMKVSFQIAIPSGSNGGSSSDSSGGSDENYTISTVEAPSINAAKALVNTYISKELNLSHCKAIVISESYATQGISDIIYTLTNDIETRPDCNLMISACDAKSILESSTPFLESLPSKYYEVNASSSKYTGYSPDTKVSEFLSSTAETFQQPCAILCGVNIGTSSDTNSSSTQSGSNTSQIASDDTSIKIESDKSGIIINGTSVFYHDKMVGELSAIETLCHLIVTGDLKDCIITIKDPFCEEGTMDLAITLNKSTKNTVDLINGSPYVQTKVNLKANILSTNENADYANEENLKTIEEYVNRYLESEISSYFYKTAKEYKSDIAGLGKKVIGKFLTWQEWEQYDWLSNYQNSFFHVSVNTNVKSGYLLLKS